MDDRFPFNIPADRTIHSIIVCLASIFSSFITVTDQLSNVRNPASLYALPIKFVVRGAIFAAGIAAAFTRKFESVEKDPTPDGAFISTLYNEGRAPPPPLAKFVLNDVTENAIFISYMILGNLVT